MALQNVARTDWKRSTDPDGRPDMLLWSVGFDRPPDFSIAATSPRGLRARPPSSRSRVGGPASWLQRSVTISMSGLPAGLSAQPVTTDTDRATLVVTGSARWRTAGSRPPSSERTAACATPAR
jgi:hypothetical protein